MRGDGLDLGNLLAEPFLHVGQVGDSRDNEKALSTAIMLAQQGFAHDDGVPGRDVGPDREAVDRRRLDHTQLAKSAHRHLQGARDRSCGEG